MATPQNIIDEVRDYEFDDLTDARILNHINDVYFDVLSRQPWPFLDTKASATVSATGLITSPTDIKQIRALKDTTNKNKLSPERIEYLLSKFDQLTDVGQAVYYYKDTDGWYVYPIGNAYAYTIRYLRVPSPLIQAGAESTILLPPRHHKVISLGVLAECYYQGDDSQMGYYFKNKYEDKLANMIEDLFQTQYDRPERVYVTDDDEFYGF